ncbi:MAG: VOC family protein [Thermoplasmata archaeon]
MNAKFIYTGIRVKDLDATVTFYTTILGLSARSRNTIAATKGVVLDVVNEDGGHPLELNFYEKGSRFDTEYEVGEALDHLGFNVTDLDASVAAAEKGGYPVVQEIKNDGSRWVYIQDPNGIWIELSV